MYTKNQVREILHILGVRIYSDTSTDFTCYCPFHHNTSTPAFAVSYEKGAFICYNSACDERGSLVDLIKRVGDMSEFQAIRLIMQTQEEPPDFDEELSKILEVEPEFVEFDQAIIDSLHDNLMNNINLSQNYFESRGINLESMMHFKLGYSTGQQMVTVPIHSPTGLLVGLVGRSIDGKRFKNSTHLPRSKTLFNLHRAKRESSTIIVVESTFDAIRLHQAGYPNVVATLGGNISKDNLANLNRYSSSIILATDADEAGRKLGNDIAKSLKKNISWASYDGEIIYPHGAKDIGDLTDDEIRKCIKNAVDNVALFMV